MDNPITSIEQAEALHADLDAMRPAYETPALYLDVRNIEARGWTWSVGSIVVPATGKRFYVAYVHWLARLIEPVVPETTCASEYSDGGPQAALDSAYRKAVQAQARNCILCEGPSAMSVCEACAGQAEPVVGAEDSDLNRVEYAREEVSRG